jgi:hypothetical protein
MSAEYTLVEPDSSNSSDRHALSKWSNREMIILLSRLITGLGNFSIQYNFQAISVSLIVMSVEQCTLTVDQCAEGKQARWVSGTVTATVFAGAILGQLCVSNRESRNRRLYVIHSLLLIILCNL